MGEHGDGAGRNRDRARPRVKGRRLDDLVGSLRLSLVQRERAPREAIDTLRERLPGRVEDDKGAVDRRIDVIARTNLVVDEHHDRSVDRARPGVREGYLGTNEVSAAQRKQPRGGAHAQEVHRGLRGGLDLRRGWLQVGVFQERTHVRPRRTILGLDGKASSKPVVLHRPVDGIEVISGVVGVAIQGLGTQELRARGPEGRRLGQRHRGLAEQRHAHSILHRRTRRHLVRDQVEERLVVVSIDVVDVLCGLGCEARTLAVVVELGSAHAAPIVGRERVVLQVARQSQLHQVDAVQVVRATFLLGTRIEPVEVREGSRAEALEDAMILVEGATAVDRIAQSVIKGADAGSVKLALSGLAEQSIVGDLAEVPSLAVDVQTRAVNPVLVQRQGLQCFLRALHLRRRVMAHEIEAEAVDVVVLRPVDHRVDHEPLAHGVLGCHIRTARRGFDRSGGVQALVVAGNDSVEHRVGVLPGRGRVVVHLVEHDLHADRVKATHHRTELSDAGSSVLIQSGRVGAFGSQPVERVVTPVVGVLIGHRVHGGLLRLGGGAGVCGDVRNLLISALLGDRCDIEGGEQVNGVDSGLGQLAEVAHAVGLILRERHVGAAHVLGNRLVCRGEVPHV